MPKIFTQPQYNTSRPPLKILVFVFLIAFSVYLLTLSPTFFHDDSPETITAAFTLGVAHPPSYPLHTLLGHLFRFIPLGNPAFQFNFFASVLGATGAALLTFNTWILLAPILRPKFPVIKEGFILPTTSIFGGLLLAISKNYWNASLTAKGSVYIFQTVLALCFFIGIQYLDQLIPNMGKAVGKIIISHLRRWLYFTASFFFIGLTNHWPMQMILVPSTLLFFGIHLNQWPKNNKALGLHFGKQLVVIISFFVIFLSSYLYLPIRSYQNPELNFDSPHNFHRLVNSITRADARKIESNLFKQDPYPVVDGHFTESEKEPRSVTAEKAFYIFNSLMNQFGWVSIFLLITGLWFLYKKAQYRILYFLTLSFLTAVLLNIFYQRLTPIEFWHLDDYLLTVNWIEALICATGLGFVLSRFVFPVFHGTLPNGHRGRVLLLVFIALPLYFLENNFSLNNQKNELFYYYYGLEALRSLDTNSIYFAETDYDLFSTLYLKTVEAKRSDVIIVPVPFFRKSYAYQEMRLLYPDILPSTSSDSPFDDLSKIVSGFGRPVYYTFSNGIFADLYLNHLPLYHFRPSGILLKLTSSHELDSARNPFFELKNFWEKSISDSLRNVSPANVLLLQACAHPFINTAEYLETKGNFTYSNWLYTRALLLIKDENWRAEIIAQKRFENKKPDLPFEKSGSF